MAFSSIRPHKNNDLQTKVAIVIPARNEEENIEKVLKSLDKE